MKKRSIAAISSSILLAIGTTTAVVSPAVQAHDLDSNIQGPLVLTEAIYYDAEADELRLSEDQIDYSRVTESEVDQARSGLANLSDDEVNQILDENGYDSEVNRLSDNSGVSFRIAPAVIWGGVALLGILTGGGLIFYSTYTTHQEKKELIDKCHENGGNPVIDSRDNTGLEGSPDSFSASKEGGYRFECQKN